MESDRELEGIVENGVVRINADDTPPDGTRVSIRILPKKRPGKQRASARKKRPVCSPEIMKFAGIIKDMPADASWNLDHYLYGTPKKPARRPRKKR